MKATIQIETVRTAIERAARYLALNTKDNGMFEYRLNLNPTINVKPKYNILRHAGSLYALCAAYQLQPTEDIKLAIERSGQYLRDEAIAPLPGQENKRAVWSKPEVNGSQNPLQAKLGGTGLGLVALLSLENIKPQFTPLTHLRSLGQFIVYMQKEGGQFYSKYIPSKGGRIDRWESLFYPGEAALGLLVLYEKDPSDIWFQSAYNALNYLAVKRKNETEIPIDHWALLATEKILSFDNNPLSSTATELLLDHAVRICEVILQSRLENAKHSQYQGGFSNNGTITPTATRLEGLLAALSFFPPTFEIRTRIQDAVEEGIEFLLHAQIKEGEFSGATPRAIDKIEGNTAAVKKFNRRASEVRIDYVQHSTSALMQYLTLINPL